MPDRSGAVVRRRRGRGGRRLLSVAVGGGLLVACTSPDAVAPGDLQSARAACDVQYPRRVGNYLPHAECVNAAVERYALPAARYADLVRLQEEVRARLSEKIDRRRLSVRAAESGMRRADALVAAAERDRSAGREAAARRSIATLEAMLE